MLDFPSFSGQLFSPLHLWLPFLFCPSRYVSSQMIPSCKRPAWTCWYGSLSLSQSGPTRRNSICNRVLYTLKMTSLLHVFCRQVGSTALEMEMVGKMHSSPFSPVGLALLPVDRSCESSALQRWDLLLWLKLCCDWEAGLSWSIRQSFFMYSRPRS